MNDEEVRALFADYMDGTLSHETRDAVQAYLTEHPDMAVELIQYERTVTLLNRLPPREPSIDIWAEIEPEVRKFRGEMRWSLTERIRNRWLCTVASISEAIIHFTHNLAETTHARLSKHLLRSHRVEAQPVKEAGMDL